MSTSQDKEVKIIGKVLRTVESLPLGRRVHVLDYCLNRVREDLFSGQPSLPGVGTFRDEPPQPDPPPQPPTY